MAGRSLCPDGNLTIPDKNICTKLLYYLDMENASNFADGIARLCYIFYCETLTSG